MSKAIVPWVINGNMGQVAMVKDTQNVVETGNTTIWLEKKRQSSHNSLRIVWPWCEHPHTSKCWIYHLSLFKHHSCVHNISSSWRGWKTKCNGKVQKVKVCGSFIFDETTKVTREKTFPPSPNLCLRRTLFGFMVNKMSN